MILDSIRRNVQGVNPELLTLESLIPGVPNCLSIDEFEHKINNTQGIKLVKTHCPPDEGRFRYSEEIIEYVRQFLSSTRKIYALRDGRDVMVSLYEYLKTQKQEFKTSSFSEFLRMHNAFDLPPDTAPFQSRPTFWKQHAEHWLKQADVVPVLYRNMTADFHNTMWQISSRMKLTMRSKTVQTKPNIKKPHDYLFRLKNKLRRTLNGNWSSAVLANRATTGYWTEYFTPDDEEFFWKEVKSMPWWDKDNAVETIVSVPPS